MATATPLVCAECRQSFERRGRRGRLRFCSKKCLERTKNQKAWAKRRPPDPESRPCVTCGTVFVPHRSHPEARCCSVQCGNRYQEKRRKAKRDAANAAAATERPCAVCERPFKTHVKRQIYCSPDCRYAASLRHRREHQARLPKGVKTARNYRTRWGGNYKLALERDGFTCRLCEATAQLEVHHINGEGEKRGDDHRLENLLTLCRKCHKGVHNIMLRQVDGRWHVSSPLFAKLGLTGSVPISE